MRKEVPAALLSSLFIFGSCGQYVAADDEGLLRYMNKQCGSDLHPEGLTLAGKCSYKDRCFAWFDRDGDTRKKECTAIEYTDAGFGSINISGRMEVFLYAGACLWQRNDGAAVHIEDENIAQIKIVEYNTEKSRTVDVTEYPFVTFIPIGDSDGDGSLTLSDFDYRFLDAYGNEINV